MKRDHQRRLLAESELLSIELSLRHDDIVGTPLLTSGVSRAIR